LGARKKFLADAKNAFDPTMKKTQTSEAIMSSMIAQKNTNVCANFACRGGIQNFLCNYGNSGYYYVPLHHPVAICHQTGKPYAVHGSAPT
jgi:hypothetical protein